MKDGWFIARHVMEVTIFKDYRRLFKYIEEIHGRTENMALLSPISSPLSHTAIALQGLQMPSCCK